jgi:hypothetical protein
MTSSVDVIELKIVKSMEIDSKQLLLPTSLKKSKTSKEFLYILYFWSLLKKVNHSKKY